MKPLTYLPNAADEEIRAAIDTLRRERDRCADALLLNDLPDDHPEAVAWHDLAQALEWGRAALMIYASRRPRRTKARRV